MGLKTDPRSAGEAQLLQQIRAYGLPTPELQHQPCPSRKWRLDFAWPERKLAVEVHGGVHVIRSRFEDTAEKELWLTAAGWRVVWVTPKIIKSGLAIDALRWLLGSIEESNWRELKLRHRLERE